MVSKTDFNDECITFSQMNLVFNARIFWQRLTTWTRIYILGRYTGIGTAEELFGRLYLESSDFGDMLRIIFGREVADNYVQLLHQYAIGLRDLIYAQLEGNEEEVAQSVNRLYYNSQQRAAFLASINPYWDENQWRDLLDTYLRYTIEEANAFAMGDYSRDIEIFDHLTALSNQLGEYFAQGLYEYITAGPRGEGVFQRPQTAPSGNEDMISRLNDRCITRDQMNAIYNIRMFWFDLATWVRSYMLSRYRGIGNENEVYARLRQVPEEFVKNMREIFGDKITDDYVRLLNEYIDLIEAFVTAQIKGNPDELNDVTQRLYQNAEERSASIASLNPFWNESEWRNRLYNNLRSTIRESTTFLTGDYARNIDVFSTILNQAESSGSYLAQGLFDYLTQNQQAPAATPTQPQPPSTAPAQSTASASYSRAKFGRRVGR